MKWISERFRIIRYLDWTDEQIAENERMWAEENAAKPKKKKTSASYELSEISEDEEPTRRERRGAGTWRRVLTAEEEAAKKWIEENADQLDRMSP